MKENTSSNSNVVTTKTPPPTSPSTSSVRSNTTMVEEIRDSCYFPGCRKDANCTCEICLASLNATLDLMPLSIQKSSLTKLSASRPRVDRTPISFNRSVVSTPKSKTSSKVESPVIKSTARVKAAVKKESKKRELGHWGLVFTSVLGLVLFLGLEIGFSWWVCGAFRPLFSPERVKGLGEKARVFEDLSGKVRFLQREVKGFVDDYDVKFSNCSCTNSVWKINQDGMLLNSKCVLYKSAMEEVSIWGWPLQTSGLLKTGFYWRSFTVLSGRVAEWSDGSIGYSIRKANNSWMQKKWGASVVQLDPNTWILEYSRSSILDNSRLSTAVAGVFKNKVSGMSRKLMNLMSLLVSAAEDLYFPKAAVREHFKVPT